MIDADAAARICPADQRFRPPSAVGRQRHSRHVEDRDRQFRDHAGALRARRRSSADCCELLALKAREAGIELVTRVCRTICPEIDRRQARAQSDHAQPALQRDQVHRPRRQGHGQRRAPTAAEHRVHGRGHRRRHRRRRSAARRRAVLPGARVLRPPPRRHRPRPFHRQRPARGCTAASCDIASRLGEGTRVTVRLPLDCERARRDKKPSGRRPPAQRLPICRSACRRARPPRRQAPRWRARIARRMSTCG